VLLVLLDSAVDCGGFLRRKHDASTVGKGNRIHKGIVKEAFAGDGNVEGDKGEREIVIR
jgi:hypothetical protein